MFFVCLFNVGERMRTAPPEQYSLNTPSPAAHHPHPRDKRLYRGRISGAVGGLYGEVGEGAGRGGSSREAGNRPRGIVRKGNCPGDVVKIPDKQCCFISVAEEQGEIDGYSFISSARSPNRVQKVRAQLASSCRRLLGFCCCCCFGGGGGVRVCVCMSVCLPACLPVCLSVCGRLPF